MKSFLGRTRLGLEKLEAREVPATLVNPTTLSYQDVDGDNVTVSFSKPILTATDVNSIFAFDNGNVNGSNTSKQQLESIIVLASAAGTNITVKATPSPVNGGDGFADIGEINASGVNLGIVSVDGDLGAIYAGTSSTTTPAIAGLNVHSMGCDGLLTGAASLVSVIDGNLGSFTVGGSVENAELTVSGSIGNVNIGGSLIGGSADSSGSIVAGISIGTVTVKGDIVGGTGMASGVILNEGTLAVGTVTIGGSVRGGSGSLSGSLVSSELGAVTIDGDLDGSDGPESALIYSKGNLGNVVIYGSLRGGSQQDSGNILAQDNMGSITVRGDVIGGAGSEAGDILSATGKMGNVKIRSLEGGSGDGSGSIGSSLSMGNVTITGGISGGGGISSGVISCSSNMGEVTITGSVSGGTGAESGSVISSGALAGITIGGSLLGGSGSDCGNVFSLSNTGSVKIGGNMVGTSNTSGIFYTKGNVVSFAVVGSIEGSIISCGGTLGSLMVGGDVTGTISAGGTANSITIDGTLLGGSILVMGNLGNLTVGGDIVGDSASGSQDVQQTGYVQAQRIAALTVGGSIISGVDNTTGTFLDNGAIRVANDIGSATIKGSLEGNTTNPVIISARGSATPTTTTDTAIGSLTVKGNVEFADIVAGVDVNGKAVNADAQIGSVLVGGNWTASSIAAGVTPGFGNYYGTFLDSVMSGTGVKDVSTVISKIGSVTIGGEAMGTIGGFDYYGIVAQDVGSVKIGSAKLPLKSGPDNDVIPIGITQDFDVREV